MIRQQLLGLFLVTLFAVEVVSVTPGFKTTLSQNGLTYLQSVGVGVLKKSVANLVIPNFDGESKTPIGKVKFTISDVRLTGFGIGSSSVKTIPGQGLELKLTGVKCDVNLKWKWKRKHFPKISDHGSGHVDVASVSSDVKIKVTQANGRPSVSVISNTLKIGHLKIKLKGGASWLYNLFIKLFSGKIKSAVEKALVTAITKNVNNGLNFALSSLPVTVPVSPSVNLNYALTENPKFVAAYLSILANGEFQHNPPTPCPAGSCARSVTPDSPTQQMLQMIVTDFVANTAGFTYFKMNKLEAKVRDENLPSWSPIRLNTTHFQLLIPALYTKYPNMKMMLRAYVTESPQVVFSTKGATVKVIGNLEVDVIDSKGAIIPVFTLGGFFGTQGSANLKGLNLCGNLTYVTGNFTLKSSQIGSFDPTKLNSLLHTFFGKGIVPAVNVILAQGFPLPVVKGLTFKSPKIGWGDRFLYVSTDVNYVPPAKTEDFIPPMEDLFIPMEDLRVPDLDDEDSN